MAEASNGKFKIIWAILTVILLCSGTALITYLINGKTSRYYKQQYEAETAKFNAATRKIDTIEGEKTIIRKDFARWIVYSDSLTGVINNNILHIAQTKQKYDSIYHNIDTWNAAQLDSLFTSRTGQ